MPLGVLLGGLLLAAAGCAGSTVRARPPGLAAVPASAWPEAFGDAAHGFPTSATGPQTGRIRWQRDLGGTVTPGPVVGADGGILAASNAGALHALDPATGQDRWTFGGGGPYGNDLSTSPAVLADGTILWPGPGDRLFALSAAGTRLWAEDFDGFVLSPALGTGGRVYIADSPGTCRRGRSGRVASAPWSGRWPPVPGPTGRRPSPRTGPSTRRRGRGCSRSSTRVRRAQCGGRSRRRTRSRSPQPSSERATPTFGDHLGNIDVLDAASGRVIRRIGTIPPSRGRSPSGVGIWTAPLVDAAGDVYFGSAAGHLYGFGPDGRRLWDLDTGGVNASYPALTANGTLVVGAGRGSLYAIAD